MKRRGFVSLLCFGLALVLFTACAVGSGSSEMIFHPSSYLTRSRSTPEGAPHSSESTEPEETAEEPAEELPRLESVPLELDLEEGSGSANVTTQAVRATILMDTFDASIYTHSNYYTLYSEDSLFLIAGCDLDIHPPRDPGGYKFYYISQNGMRLVFTGVHSIAGTDENGLYLVMRTSKSWNSMYSKLVHYNPVTGEMRTVLYNVVDALIQGNALWYATNWHEIEMGGADGTYEYDIYHHQIYRRNLYTNEQSLIFEDNGWASFFAFDVRFYIGKDCIVLGLIYPAESEFAHYRSLIFNATTAVIAADTSESVAQHPRDVYGSDTPYVYNEIFNSQIDHGSDILFPGGQLYYELADADSRQFRYWTIDENGEESIVFDSYHGTQLFLTSNGFVCHSRTVHYSSVGLFDGQTLYRPIHNSSNYATAFLYKSKTYISFFSFEEMKYTFCEYTGTYANPSSSRLIHRTNLFVTNSDYYLQRQVSRAGPFYIYGQYNYENTLICVTNLETEEVYYLGDVEEAQLSAPQ